MGFFDKKHEKDSPIGNLRAHIGTFIYFVKVGKSKFKHKGRVGEIFADMENTQYLFQQATMGTMYDIKRKLDYTLWDAAVHKYKEDLAALKAELLKAVDEGALEKKDLEEKEEARKEEAEKPAEEAGESGDWTEVIKGQMKKAEEAAREKEEKKKEEKEDGKEDRFDQHMTEADCRELWRLIQGMEREFGAAQDIAEEWFQVHGAKSGCLGALLMMALIPAGALYGLWHLL